MLCGLAVQESWTESGHWQHQVLSFPQATGKKRASHMTARRHDGVPQKAFSFVSLLGTLQLLQVL